MKARLVFTFVLATVLVGCIESNSADERLRAYLGMSASQELTEQSIRDAFLRKIPLGTSADEVQRRLYEAGIGKDKLSSYIAPDASGKAWIKVEFDPTTFGFVKTSYGIPLSFAPDMKLTGVEVKKWLTGL